MVAADTCSPSSHATAHGSGRGRLGYHVGAMSTGSSVKTVKMVVNRRALVRACGRAAQAGVGRGGVYDVRGSALVIWDAPWPSLPLRPKGEPIGMISWHWGTPAPPFATIHRVEAGDGHTVEEILDHLRRLLEPTPREEPGEEYR